MREAIATALKDAQKAQDKERISTLRMVNAAIQERDIANRGSGKGPAGNDEVTQILTKMVKQREESAKAYDDGGRPELAAKERGEISLIREFLPRQLGEAETRAAVASAIADAGATSVRDMGKVMGLLKERHAGSLDFSRAGALVKELLG